jgi:hypothetical protein
MRKDEISRADRKILLSEVMRPRRIVLYLLSWAPFAYCYSNNMFPLGAFLAVVSALVYYLVSLIAANQRKFINPQFADHWEGCRERFMSFDEGLKQLHRVEIAKFEELPKTIHEIAKNLYTALRRADIMFHEISRSEGIERIKPAVPHIMPSDPQAQELYRIADKNIAEYRTNYSELMGGIQRTEAQSAVFMTTLDSLRVKMLSYRLVGKNPSMNSNEFLSALAESRAQLSAIDKALDELDLGHYPTTISIVNPTIETNFHPEEQNQNS